MELDAFYKYWNYQNKKTFMVFYAIMPPMKDDSNFIFGMFYVSSPSVSDVTHTKR